MKSNPMSLEGKSILVTGAAQGIGRTIVDQAILLGANVAGVDLNGEGLESVREEHGDRFLPLVGNVTDTDFVSSAVERSVETFGNIDGLVNNAGITRTAMIEKMDKVSFDLVMEVHVKGSFNFTQAVGHHWLARARSGESAPGAVVNISSDAGRRGAIGQINYSAAKSALFGVTMSTAREWGRYGVRANAVCYGVVETAMTETLRSNEKFSEFYMSQIPLERWCTPEEAVVPVCFLLSDGASYITGQVLSVNGGYTMAL